MVGTVLEIWKLSFVETDAWRVCYIPTSETQYIVLITPLLSGDILQQNGDRAERRYPPAIFVAGAQRDARVFHCKNQTPEWLPRVLNAL